MKLAQIKSALHEFQQRVFLKKIKHCQEVELTLIFRCYFFGMFLRFLHFFLHRPQEGNFFSVFSSNDLMSST